MNARIQSHTPRKRLARRLPGVSLTLALAAILVFLCPRLTGMLQYDRAAVLSGEGWRLVTCQWTHWNFSHVVWDVMMFFTLGVLCEQLRRGAFVACVAASALLIPLLSAVALPQMQYYRGLSGLDSALFVLLAVQLIRMNRSRDRVVFATAAAGLGAFVLKTLYECATGSIIFVQPEFVFTPVPLAHVIGGAIGFVIAICGGSSERKSSVAIARSHRAADQKAHNATPRTLIT
ncbi:MAG: rhombosortase [Phycisphaerales bacterium]|nr:MAG: rhombosortase [Phycisphaerales bacterium]